MWFVVLPAVELGANLSAQQPEVDPIVSCHVRESLEPCQRRLVVVDPGRDRGCGEILEAFVDIDKSSRPGAGWAESLPFRDVVVDNPGHIRGGRLGWTRESQAATDDEESQQ